VKTGENMYFAKLSFRTNRKERELLSRLNERYKCRSITAFMHWLLQEIDDTKPSVHQPVTKIPDMFGDLDFGLSSVKQEAKPEKPVTREPISSSQKEPDPLGLLEEYLAPR
jgi:hypothetical protein